MAGRVNRMQMTSAGDFEREGHPFYRRVNYSSNFGENSPKFQVNKWLLMREEYTFMRPVMKK